MTSELPPPMVDATPPGGTRIPRKTSLLGRAIVVLALVAFAVPVGVRIKTALAQKKAIDDDRAKTAQAAASKADAKLVAKIVRGAPDTWEPAVAFDGTLAPVQEAMLAFKATGPIATLKVKVGDFVTKGAVLATLDAAEAYAQQKAAAAQIKAAEAQVALAKDAAERTSAMVKTGAAPVAQGTQTQGQLDLGIAQLEGAQAQHALATAAIRNHTLVAPFSGFVTQAPTAVGGLVVAGQPVFQMKDVSRLRLIGTIGEQDVSLVKVGGAVEIRVGAGDELAHAKITAVLPAVDPATRRIPVEAELSNADHKLLAGTFVRAFVKGGAAVPVLRFPASALRPGSQDELMVVEGGKLRVAKIVFSRASDGSLLVRSGVSAKDDVLAAPAPEAKAGDLVTVE